MPAAVPKVEAPEADSPRKTNAYIDLMSEWANEQMPKTLSTNTPTKRLHATTQMSTEFSNFSDPQKRQRQNLDQPQVNIQYANDSNKQ